MVGDPSGPSAYLLHRKRSGAVNHVKVSIALFIEFLHLKLVTLAGSVEFTTERLWAHQDGETRPDQNRTRRTELFTLLLAHPFGTATCVGC